MRAQHILSYHLILVPWDVKAWIRTRFDKKNRFFLYMKYLIMQKYIKYFDFSSNFILSKNQGMFLGRNRIFF